MGLIKRAMPEAEDKLDPNEQPEGTPVDAKEDVAEGEPLDSGDAGEQGGAGGPEYDKFLAAAKVLLFKKGGLAERQPSSVSIVSSDLEIRTGLNKSASEPGTPIAKALADQPI